MIEIQHLETKVTYFHSLKKVRNPKNEKSNSAIVQDFIEQSSFAFRHVSKIIMHRNLFLFSKPMVAFFINC